jgi:hypothetical protein
VNHLAKGRRGPWIRAASAALALATALAPAAAAADEPAAKPSAPKSDAAKPDAPKGDAKPDAPAQDAPKPESDKKAEARAHFDKGKELSNEGAWAAALAEFLASRELYPTWGNTLGAASSLRKLARFDEALDMFEILLRDFPGALSNDVRTAAQREVVELRGLVGTIEIDGAELGAAITVDGRPRGEYPAPSPLRVAAGTHVVRVAKEGFEPFEQRVDVAGNRTARVNAVLRPLAAAGRLRVAEQGGAALDVIIDGDRVGAAPWEGPLAPGDHVLLLRGEGDLGTLPVAVSVKRNETTRLTLAAEKLTARIRVEPEPVSASVAIDGVTVGQGTWEGRLRAGKHRVEIASQGFTAAAREISLADGQREVVHVPLARDPSSPFWRKPPPPSRFLAEIAGSVPIVPSFGGDVAGGCAGECSANPGLGAYVALRGGYELSSGLGFGLAAAFLYAEQDVTGRGAALQPVGLTGAAKGSLDDALAIRRGFLVGPWLGFSYGERFPIHVRVAVGPMFAWLGDTREGSFTPVREGPGYPVGPLSVTTFVPFLHVTPDVRVGYRVTPSFEVAVGVDALVLIALSDATWDGTRPINAGTDGIGTFGAERLVGNVLFGIAPGVSARYDFF